MSDKFLAITSGRIGEIIPVTTSTGATDAGKVAALDTTGKWDASMLPATAGSGPHPFLLMGG